MLTTKRARARHPGKVRTAVEGTGAVSLRLGLCLDVGGLGDAVAMGEGCVFR